jgi:surfactin synthase thioesterase subunit
MQRSDDARDRWIVRLKPRPEATLRVFCFPYAGAGSTVFRGWLPFVPDDVELCVVVPPGREAALTDFPTVTALATAAIVPYLDRPYAIFGHSLGASIGFEVARALEAAGRPSPLVFVPSGRRAPTVASRRAPIAGLPDDDAFLDAIARSNGPDPAFDAFRAEPELVAMVMPLLRADFTLVEAYRPLSERPLACPITAFAAYDDPHAPEDAILPWLEQTTAAFAHRMFAGTHLYLNAHRDVVVPALMSVVRP